MIILYMIIVGFAILAMGISGIATSKNFLVIMFSIELIIIAASLIGFWYDKEEAQEAARKHYD